MLARRPAATAVHATAILTACVLAACVLAGALVRLEPVRRAGRVEFDFDAAFHFREVRAAAETGHVPAIDPLGLPPAGKPVAALLPTLFYHVVAFWHRLLGWLGLAPDLRTSAVLFIALAGGLISVPLYAAARALGLGRGAALLAAAFAAACPAHVHRTAGHWLRYDALGTLLVITHVAALAAALAAGRGRGLAAWSAGAALALAAAIAAWRVPLLLVALESLAVLALFVAGKLERPLLIAVAPSLAAALATSLAIPYLLSGPFLLSRTGSLAFLALGLLLLDAATAFHRTPGRAAAAARLALVAGILGVSFFLGAPSAYDSLGGALARKLGLGKEDVGAVLLATNAEMSSPRPTHLVDADYFSAMAPLALLYAAGRRWPRRRPLIAPPAARAAPGLALWHTATLALFLLTLLFARNKVLAGPLLALYPALLLDGIRRAGGRVRPHVAAALLLAALAWTAHDAWRLASILPARLDPEIRSALAWLRTEARPGDVVLGDWGRGYVVQLEAGLPTVTDGFLELPEMRRRIAAFGAALYAEDEAPLLELCRDHGVRFVWVPGEKRQVHAAYAGLRYADYFAGGRPTARGLRTNYVKLLRRPEEVRGLTLRLEAAADRIYEVTGPPATSAPE